MGGGGKFGIGRKRMEDEEEEVVEVGE